MIIVTTKQGVEVFVGPDVLYFSRLTIRKRGGGVVEAFPLDVPGTSHPQYTGSIKMYKREGFREVTHLGKNIVLMRCNVRVDYT